MGLTVSKRLLCSAIGMAVASQGQAAAIKLDAFVDGKPAAVAEVLLDGESIGSSAMGESFWYDEVGGGRHQLQVRIDGEVIPYEFSVSADEAAVITVNHASASGESTKSLQRIDLARFDASAGDAVMIAPGEGDNLAPGLIQGTVVGKDNAAPLRNVTVRVVGGDAQAVTDRDGNFELQLPPGVYELQLDREEYRSSRLAALRVLPKMNLAVDVQMSAVDTAAEVPASASIEEVQVVGRYLESNPIALERISSSVVDSIDFTQIARFDDSMVSSALKRVVGVSMEDDRFAVVRGMKGRYQSVEFNGASLPSTDPGRRDLPFDIFPAGIMQSLSLQKNATADVPLIATAGHIDMRTKDIPDEGFFKVSYSASRGDSHGDDLLMSSTEGDRDWLGMDDGTRELPESLRPTVDYYLDLKQTGEVTEGYNTDEVEALGEAVPHSAIYFGEAELDSSLSFSGGDSWELGRQNLGVIGAVRYANKWSSNIKENTRFRGVELASGETELRLDSENETLDTNHVIDLSAMLNLQWDITDNHQLGLNNIALRHTTSSSELETSLVAFEAAGQDFAAEAAERLRRGEESGLRENVDTDRATRQRSEWIEEQLVSHQLWGSHSLDISADRGWSLYLGNLELEWQVMGAETEYDRPNASLYTYFMDSMDDSVRLSDSAGSQYNIWEDMTEENDGYRLDLALPVEDLGGVSLLFKAGLQDLQRDRDGNFVRYSFHNAGGWQSSGVADPREILTPENIVGSLNDEGWLLRVGSYGTIKPEADVGLVGDDYLSELQTDAHYGVVEANILEKLKVNLGVRKETFVLDAELFAFTPEPLTNLMDKERTNPSLGLTWMFNDAWQLRAAWSETVNWPEVFEVLPRRFNDIETLEQYRGNPELKPADIENLDLRLEWYPSETESITLALFRKQLDNAIENRFYGSGEVFDIYTFGNALEAEVEGVELDMRREFTLGADGGHQLFVQFNYTDITSSVDLVDGGSSFEREINRPLQGQPDYIANLQLGYDHLDTGQEVTLVFNQTGEELAIVAPPTSKAEPLGDVYEQPYGDLKLIYKKEFLNGLSVSASAENLLDAEHDYEYEEFSVPYLKYKSGRKFKLKASYDF